MGLLESMMLGAFAGGFLHTIMQYGPQPKLELDPFAINKAVFAALLEGKYP